MAAADLYPRKPIVDKAGHRLAPTLGDHLVPIPVYYYCQIQWGMGLLRKDRSLFGVWCPAGQTKALPFVGMGDHFASDPQPYRVLRHAVVEPAPGSRIVEDTVATKHGLIQLTDVPFDRTFFEWMRTLVEAFWRDRYVPAAFQQQAAAEAPAAEAPAAEAPAAEAPTEAAKNAIAEFVKAETAKAEATITAAAEAAKLAIAEFVKAETAKAEATINH